MKFKNNISAKAPNTSKPLPFLLQDVSLNSEDYDISNIEISEDKLVNWPMVYILTNDKNKKAYVGQTTNANIRMSQHKANPNKNFEKATFICHDQFNGSVITDYEHRLIMLMAADGKYKLTNKNKGREDRNYFSKTEYTMMFNNLWESLMNLKLAKRPITEIEDSEIFKYSPYKELNDDQIKALDEIENIIKRKYSKSNQGLSVRNKAPIVVAGMPGTGKTILLIYLLKLLRDDDKFKNLKIKIIQPDPPLRKSLQNVASSISGLHKNDIISPTDLSKEKFGFKNGKNDYDIILVDEAHKLKQRQNIVNYKSYDKTNKILYPGKSKDQLDKITQLDWVMKQAKLPIFFYDPLQAIRPSGIYEKDYKEIIDRAGTTYLELTSQMRVQGGTGYLKFIQEALNCNFTKKLPKFTNYEFVIHENFDEFYDSFENKLKEHSLTRMLAGYAWKWNKKHRSPDIKLGSHKLFWNTDVSDWVGRGLNNPKIAHEVGCIHKIQGYDLSYAYVIIGKDITLSEDGKSLVALKENYFDTNGKNKASQEELNQYIKNIYYVLLTRGIKGTHVYFDSEILSRVLSTI